MSEDLAFLLAEVQRLRAALVVRNQEISDMNRAINKRDRVIKKLRVTIDACMNGAIDKGAIARYMDGYTAYCHNNLNRDIRLDGAIRAGLKAVLMAH